MERTTFTKWMQILSLVLCNPVPEEVNRCEPCERDQLPWWKVKKWALHTMYRIFERLLLTKINHALRHLLLCFDKISVFFIFISDMVVLEVLPKNIRHLLCFMSKLLRLEL